MSSSLVHHNCCGVCGVVNEVGLVTESSSTVSRDVVIIPKLVWPDVITELVWPDTLML